MLGKSGGNVQHTLLPGGEGCLGVHVLIQDQYLRFPEPLLCRPSQLPATVASLWPTSCRSRRHVDNFLNVCRAVSTNSASDLEHWITASGGTVHGVQITHSPLGGRALVAAQAGK